MRALLPGPGRLLPVGLTALRFGAVHLPDWRLALVTAAVGLAWSEADRRHRLLLPIAVSHAVLGTACLGWVRGDDLVSILRRGP